MSTLLKFVLQFTVMTNGVDPVCSKEQSDKLSAQYAVDLATDVGVQKMLPDYYKLS